MYSTARKRGRNIIDRNSAHIKLNLDGDSSKRELTVIWCNWAKQYAKTLKKWQKLIAREVIAQKEEDMLKELNGMKNGS